MKSMYTPAPAGGRGWAAVPGFLVLLAWGMIAPTTARAGNFYPGTAPVNVPWPGGVVPYEFTNSLTAPQRETYLDALREWELAANVRFVPRSAQGRWILFSYDPHGGDSVSAGDNPQVVSVSRLSRSQIAHEMGHSFGFTHENIRPDQGARLTVLTPNVAPGNLHWFQVDPASVVHGEYDFESVMHLGWDFGSLQPGVAATQQPLPPFQPRYQYRMGNFALSPGDRAALRHLYGPPATPLTNVVTTTADVGPGSLRAALYFVADHPGSTVRFGLSTLDPGFSNGVFTIRLTGHLPPLARDGMVIDGTTQPGYAGRPLVVIDGSGILSETQTSNSGLLIYSASNQVRGLSFQGFDWNGLTLRTADANGNTIAGCWIGLGADGTNAAPNQFQGILIDRGASGNVIGGVGPGDRNVISGNRQYGLWISDSNTTGNRVLGNYIGTDASGMLAISNAAGGVGLFGQSSGQTIGGPTPGARNVISGNADAGVWLSGPEVSGNTVQGNWIGLNAAGTAALPNTFAGLNLLDGAHHNRILSNVISGNAVEGMRIAGHGTRDNAVEGNWIGTDADGAGAVPNGFLGVALYDGASDNRIGGGAMAAGNVISGNNAEGIRLAGAGVSSNRVQGNFIGTDVAGTVPLANGWAGLTLFASASGNLIGGGAPGEGNVISGNNTYGIVLGEAGTSGNAIQGNAIGTRADREGALGNGWDGVALFGGTTSNVIGLALDGTGTGNVLAFNGARGIDVGGDGDAASVGNTIRGNRFRANGKLGINLEGGGEDSFEVTANDGGDPDAGPNRLQNFPVVTNAFTSSANTVVQGRLESAAGRAFVIDVYHSTAADASGHGEGEVHAGSAVVNTDANGRAGFALILPGDFAGRSFAATATALATGDTSEFGRAVRATNAPSPPVFALESGLGLTETGFVATLQVSVGQRYRVQSTTNLGLQPIPWLDLTNFVAGSTNVQWVDRRATNGPTRFYRLVSP